MKDLEPIVHEFASKLAALLQRHVNEALGGGARTMKALGGGDGTGIKPSRPSKRAKGEKRTAAEMEQLRARVLRMIDDNPGRRTEELNASLGTTTKDLALPLRKLVSKKLVKTEGERRGTRYFVTSKGSKS